MVALPHIRTRIRRYHNIARASPKAHLGALKYPIIGAAAARFSIHPQPRELLLYGWRGKRPRSGGGGPSVEMLGVPDPGCDRSRAPRLTYAPAANILALLAAQLA